LSKTSTLLTSRPLADQGQWADLVGYWIAHQHAPALDAAITLVRDRARSASLRVSALASFLEDVRSNPLDLDRARPLLNTEDLGPEGTVAIVLALYFPRVALLEAAELLPRKVQDEALRAGIEVADKLSEVVVEIPDAPLFAFLRFLQGDGYRKLGDRESRDVSTMRR